jgi:membrane-associated phospholipid phosphatase
LEPQSKTSVFFRYLKLMAGFYALWVCLYFLTAWIGSLRGPAFDAALPFDDGIPFLPAFQPAYLLCYIIPLGLFAISLRPEFLRRSFATFIGANLFAFCFFVLLPVQGPPRDFAIDGNSAFSFLISVVHAVDTRYNAFPSLHVANPWMVALFSWRERGPGARSFLFIFIASLISISTLFVKQHYALDVLGGMALAIVSFLAGAGFGARRKLTTDD